MITIITGTPGAGKTALAVSMLLEVKDRPIYVDGIPELQIPHDVCEGQKWHELPDGALVVIDEAQRVFRPRAASSQVPEYVAQLETHRHRGIDIWLVTQHPTLLDSNVRKLCNRHVHIRALWAGRRLYEWAEVADPSSRSERESSASRKYKLPKNVFSLYKSASLHTKQPRRIPIWFFVIVAALVAVPLLGWRLYQSISGRFEPAESAAPVMTGRELGQPVPTGAGGRPAPAAPVGVTVAEFEPRLAGRPESAPLYDAIREVKAMPVIAGCVASRTRCACYSEQGTDVGLTGEQCRAWLENPPFNPYREPVQMAAASVPTSEPK